MYELDGLTQAETLYGADTLRTVIIQMSRTTQADDNMPLIKRSLQAAVGAAFPPTSLGSSLTKLKNGAR